MSPSTSTPSWQQTICMGRLLVTTLLGEAARPGRHDASKRRTVAAQSREQKVIRIMGVISLRERGFGKQRGIARAIVGNRGATTSGFQVWPREAVHPTNAGIRHLCTGALSRSSNHAKTEYLRAAAPPANFQSGVGRVHAAPGPVSRKGENVVS
jgi:hypothetical protein